jgi:hypothetical protein
MEIFANFSKDSEAADLQKELQKLLPELQHLYSSNQFETFVKRYFSISDEYKSMSLVMTEKGMNDYMMNLLALGKKTIDNDIPNGTALIFMGILGRASRIDNAIARQVVASLKKEIEKIDRHYKAM